uniref:Uncharacterized protein n=1 Tax=Sipha flava TaxID=143950 RepID=A0A2S2R4C7_9HEMI
MDFVTSVLIVGHVSSAFNILPRNAHFPIRKCPTEYIYTSFRHSASVGTLTSRVRFNFVACDTKNEDLGLPTIAQFFITVEMKICGRNGVTKAIILQSSCERKYNKRAHTALKRLIFLKF